MIFAIVVNPILVRHLWRSAELDLLRSLGHLGRELSHALVAREACVHHVRWAQLLSFNGASRRITDQAKAPLAIVQILCHSLERRLSALVSSQVSTFGIHISQ